MLKKVMAMVLVVSMFLTISISARATETTGYREVIPYMYSNGYYFSEGLAPVMKYIRSDACWGFVDKNNNEIIPFAFTRAYPFSEGLAAVQSKVKTNVKTTASGGETWSIEQKCGYINKSGETVIPFMYEAVRSFSNGVAVVRLDGKWGGVDKENNIVIPFVYEYIGSLSLGSSGTGEPGQIFFDGLTEAKRDGKIGYIDSSGNEVIPFIYEYVFPFSEGLALVSKNLIDWVYIDVTGKVVLDTKGIAKITGPEGRKIPFMSFNDGLASAGNFIYVSTSDPHYLYWAPEGMGYIDKSGNIAIPFIYTDAQPFSEGLAAVRDGNRGNPGKMGYIDTSGNVVIPFIYDVAEPFSEGLALVGIDGKLGFIDTSGNTVAPFIYSQVDYSFVDGIAMVRLHEDYRTDTAIGGNVGFIEKTGNTQQSQTQKDETSQIKPSSWAEAQVNEAIATNLVPQSLQSKYTQPITRAEFCVLAVALYENVKGEITGRKAFTDTNDENVEKMAAIGVVAGMNTEGTLFSPNSELTREQAAAMLARLADAIGKPLTKQTSTATDKDSFSTWAAESIGQVQAAGIMSSTSISANVFSPKSPYTREQSIMTILRLYNIVK